MPGGAQNASVRKRPRPSGSDHDRGGWQRRTSRLAQRGWIDHGLRVGLASRGIVYVLLGYLAARIAAGALDAVQQSHSTASGPGVAQAIARQPGGHAALFILAFGLVLYALFSLVDAVTHHDRESPAWKRWGDRALSAWGCVVYGVFSVYCFLTAGSPSGGQQTAAQAHQQDTQWSARVLGWPGGQFWLAVLGGVLLIISVFLTARAARRSFRPRLHRDRMSRRAWIVANWTGTIGYLGRALLFGTVGWFVMDAAITDEPQHGQGVDGSIRMLARSAPGAALLWTIAGALAVYGAYLFFEARYRRV